MAGVAIGPSWRVVRARDRAAILHRMGVTQPVVREVRVLEATAPALVLGSTQPMVERDDVDVVRRRSGGGAVLVEPGAVVWIDVVVPRGDDLWDDDVARAFWWLGDAWVAALGALGVDGAEVHRGPLIASPLSSLVCFAGLGPGEVVVGGRKAVGMSQRRTREGALFQCAVPLAWHGARLVELLGLERLDADVFVVAQTHDEVVDAFLQQLL
jgi:lipoate-protein ligase A